MKTKPQNCHTNLKKMFTQADSLISKDQDLEVLHDMSLQITVFLMYVLLTQHPVTTYGYAFLFSLTGYFGISFVLALIKLFGALVAVTGKISPLFWKYFWDGHSNLVNKGKWINGLTFLFFSLFFFLSPVTTGRKAMTIVLSFLFFSKPFTFQ